MIARPGDGPAGLTSDHVLHILHFFRRKARAEVV